MIPRRSVLLLTVSAALIFHCRLASGTAILPSTPEERERWARPRPEPVTLDLPGWIRSSPEKPKDPAAHDPFPNRYVITFKRDGCGIELVRNWDFPLSPGEPGTIDGEKTVTVAGRPAKLYEMTLSGSGKVQQIGLKGKGYDVDYLVLLRFRNCPDTVIDDVLKRVEVHW